MIPIKRIVLLCVSWIVNKNGRFAINLFVKAVVLTIVAVVAAAASVPSSSMDRNALWYISLIVRLLWIFEKSSR